VRVVAEVFGPETWIGIWRAEWGTPRAERQRREGAG